MSKRIRWTVEEDETLFDFAAVIDSLKSGWDSVAHEVNQFHGNFRNGYACKQRFNMLKKCHTTHR